MRYNWCVRCAWIGDVCWHHWSHVSRLMCDVDRCTGSGKEGLRFDGSDKTGTANGEMSYNVVWNNSGLGVKGNKHSMRHVFAWLCIALSAASTVCLIV